MNKNFPAKSALIALSPNLSNFLLQAKYESLMPLLWPTLSGMGRGVKAGYEGEELTIHKKSIFV
ncbi:hypothetical protein [Akkermansia muciniphila]|uniref:hypothetical protein n=1 Tax=Akkermansia muciniphila TaxID=239935 RepID=UPI001BFFAC25|nr:hypothetical protein [Akkermansia muciniphila]